MKPTTIPSRLHISAALSVMVVLVGSVIAVGSSTNPASAATVDYLITPTGFDFGDVAMNSPSPAQQVTVTNISGATIMPILTGGNAGVFGGTDHCSHVKLPNRGSCTLSYQFTPDSIGARTTTINPSMNGQAFTLTFQGNGINPFLITPTALDFGNVAGFGHSATQWVTITNTGTVNESANITGLDLGDFAVITDPDCAIVLAPGQHCEIGFQFDPTTFGTQSATATGVLDSQQFAIHMTGRSYKGAKPTTPALLVTPTALDFGDVTLHSEFINEEPVTFTNVSDAPITPELLIVNGPYQVDAGCFGAIAPGASCTENFQFDPSTTGRQNGAASGTWGGQAFSISLFGNSLNQFLITPTSFDFGSVPAGSQSAPQDVVITNLSDAATLSATEIASNGDFPKITDCQGVALLGGDSCRLVYEFTPSGPFSEGGSIGSVWNGQQYIMGFTGTGTAVKPAVTGISPAAGPKAGGTTVTVNGHGFTGTTQVLFGSTPGTNVGVASDHQLTVTAPAHGSGAANVHVVTSLGTSLAVDADLYTFLAAPVVTAVSPTSGPRAGGTTVTVTGSGFTGATHVLFGNTPGTGLSVTSDTQLTVRAPSHSLGLTHVHVITPAGGSPAVTADEYTFEPLPTVTAISPTSGPHAGGTTVAVTGTGFTGATQVLFGSTPGTNLSVTSSTHLTVTSPAHSTGPFNVHVVTPTGGESAAGSADLYTYN